jgi:hypothetical protein
LQIDDEGKITTGVYAPVPRPYPHTSMAGEHMGVALVGLGAAEDTTLQAVGDCLTIVKDCIKGITDKLFWK